MSAASLRHLWTTDEDMSKVARANRERPSAGTKWVAFNAIAEHLDYGRRYTSRTNQVQRSIEDIATKQRALDLVQAA